MKMLDVHNLGKKFNISDRSVLTQSLKDYAQDLFQLGKRKKDFWAIRNINFSADEGEVVGVVGPNGSGKTTLLRVISQCTEPSEGKVEYRGRLGALLGANAGFHPDINSIDNIYLAGSIMGFKIKEIDQNIDKIIEFSELEKFIYEPIKHLSSGMQMRLGLSIVLCMMPEIFIFDEVIFVIDESFRKKIYEYFEKNIVGKRLAILVNHDKEYMEKIAPKSSNLKTVVAKIFTLIRRYNYGIQYSTSDDKVL